MTAPAQVIGLLLVGILLGASPLMAQEASQPSTALPTKSVRRAVLLSLVLPGGGQFYLGHPLRGTVFAATELTFLGLAAWKYRTYQETQAPEDLQSAFGVFILFVGTWAFSAADAYVSANLYGYKQKIRMVLQENSIGMLWEVPMP